VIGTFGAALACLTESDPNSLVRRRHCCCCCSDARTNCAVSDLLSLSTYGADYQLQQMSVIDSVVLQPMESRRPYGMQSAAAVLPKLLMALTRSVCVCLCVFVCAAPQRVQVCVAFDKAALQRGEYVYQSPEYTVDNSSVPQLFALPYDCFVTGRYVRLMLLGRYETHFVPGLDHLYYICLSRVYVCGTPVGLLPERLAKAAIAHALHHHHHEPAAEKLDSVPRRCAVKRDCPLPASPRVWHDPRPGFPKTLPAEQHEQVDALFRTMVSYVANTHS